MNSQLLSGSTKASRTTSSQQGTKTWIRHQCLSLSLLNASNTCWNAWEVNFTLTLIKLRWIQHATSSVSVRNRPWKYQHLPSFSSTDWLCMKTQRIIFRLKEFEEQAQSDLIYQASWCSQRWMTPDLWINLRNSLCKKWSLILMDWFQRITSLCW